MLIIFLREGKSLYFTFFLFFSIILFWNGRIVGTFLKISEQLTHIVIQKAKSPAYSSEEQLFRNVAVGMLSLPAFWESGNAVSQGGVFCTDMSSSIAKGCPHMVKSENEQDDILWVRGQKVVSKCWYFLGGCAFTSFQRCISLYTSLRRRSGTRKQVQMKKELKKHICNVQWVILWNTGCIPHY